MGTIHLPGTHERGLSRKSFAAKADALVTSDADQLSLAGTSTVPIFSPADLQQLLVMKNGAEQRC